MYRRLGTANDRLTLKQFWDDTPYDRFIEKIRKTSTIFRRGLPGEDALQKSSVARVFQTVLECHSIDGKAFNKEGQDALESCFTRGGFHHPLIHFTHLYFYPS